MKTLGNVIAGLIGLGIFLAFSVVVALPGWLVTGLIYLVLFMVLAALDAKTGRVASQALLTLVAWIWTGAQALARRHGHRLPALPFRRREVIPRSARYRYVVPGTGGKEVLWVDVPPAAVYDYFAEGARRSHEYIGKAVNPDVRHQQHVDDRRYFTTLPRDVQWFPCECVALAVERTAIQQLHPVENIQHNSRPLL